jgi:uncharacterized protein (TIGR02466 family)
MEVLEYFKTPIWYESKPEFVKSLNQASDKYIKEAIKRNKDYIKKNSDFGMSHPSTPLTQDTKFMDIRNYVGHQAWTFLDKQGHDMQHYSLIFSEMWVQEFAKKGGGHQSAHVHWNQHVSGFYFLKCSEETSYPIFHEPRTGARATKLKMKPSDQMLSGNDLIHFKPKPGMLILFPGFLEHEFSVDRGKHPFRFIHFNLQAVPKEMAKDEF